MYSGKLMDNLMDMVARAENHAQELRAAAEVKPAPVSLYVPNYYVYDTTSRQSLVGVA